MRDIHLFGPGPKRILSLDGGGVRGAISVAFLAEIERLVRGSIGPVARLGEWFDLIGGTSTGAIIAGGLALGYSTVQLEEFYRVRAQRVFRRSAGRIPGIKSRFDAKLLVEEIERVVGTRSLDTPDLMTGYALVMKRIDTGSTWILANNPRASFWDTPSDNSFIGNRHYRLSNIVRASAAAPFYFDPEVIPIHESQPKGLFIDGGVTVHNNPAFALFQLATLQSHGLCWPVGANNLTIVSVGTGGHRRTLNERDLGFMAPVRLAYHALASLMDDTETHVLALMQWLGDSQVPWVINREVGSFSNEGLPPGPLFKFVRYDVRLEREWLAENFDQPLTDKQIVGLRQMDDPSNIPLAYEIGRQAAVKQVRPEHIGLGSIPHFVAGGPHPGDDLAQPSLPG